MRLVKPLPSYYKKNTKELTLFLHKILMTYNVSFFNE
jgi:hypothetical protein